MKRLPILCTLLAGMVVLTSGSRATAGSFTVTDSDFVGGVYDFHYYTYPNTSPSSKRTVINGIDQGITDPTLTKSGWGFGDSFTPNIGFWAANGPFAATSTSGTLTMGWDFSAISGQIASVEVKTRNYLFQFGQWVPHAVGDEITGSVATPNSFGSGSYTQMYSFVGDNNATTKGTGSIDDITSMLSGSWLANPNLLEFKFSYNQTPNPTIPGRHIQIFRDNTGTGDDGFLLRVKLASGPSPVPEPSSIVLMGLGGIALAGYTWRRKRQQAA